MRCRSIIGWGYQLTWYPRCMVYFLHFQPFLSHLSHLPPTANDYIPKTSRLPQADHHAPTTPTPCLAQPKPSTSISSSALLLSAPNPCPASSPALHTSTPSPLRLTAGHHAPAPDHVPSAPPALCASLPAMMPLHARAIISIPRPCLHAHRALPPIPRLCTPDCCSPIIASHAKETRSTGQIGIID
ncbi:hypothetical protein SLEP1_g24454 [Rubroshorea leprosula]|uniref:Uncharacterized protein n=1 Tax=Rubroshorea leprosula TaxID=152421 RepID=A0AAV5JIV9_9ROSI|nr:hypothetical protein SLEP1_g24454 [Rubroshorea leprosula]